MASGKAITALEEKVFCGIIKEEYLNNYQTDNLPEAKKQLQKTISLYNNDRPHLSISNLTPNKLHNNQKINHQRLWKNYFKKLNTFEKKSENDPVNLLQDLSINRSTFFRTSHRQFNFQSNVLASRNYLSHQNKILQMNSNILPEHCIVRRLQDCSEYISTFV